MKGLLLTGVAVLALAGCNSASSSSLSCSSTEASNTLKDLIQTKVIVPFADGQRKVANDGIAQFQAIGETMQSNGKNELLMYGVMPDRCTEAIPDNPNIYNIPQLRAQCVKRAEDRLATAEAEIAKLKVILANIDTNPLMFVIQDVVTTDKTDFKTSCKATLHLSGGS